MYHRKYTVARRINACIFTAERLMTNKQALNLWNLL